MNAADSLAVAVVPVVAQGGLSALLHGEPLFAHAARAAVEAVGAASVVVQGGRTLGAVLTSVLSTPQAEGYARSAAVLVHDPHCPLVPASYLLDVLATARADPAAVLVATRAMTDTVKSVVDGVVVATVDRTLLRVLSSPLVLPVGLLRDLMAQGELPGCADVADLVERVRAFGARVRWTPAPGLGRRVSDVAAVSVLECLTVPSI